MNLIGRHRARSWGRAVVLALGCALLVAALVASTSVLLAVMFAGIWGLAIFCWTYRAKSRKRGGDKSQPFQYGLCTIGVLYLVPMGIGILLFIVFARFAVSHGETLSISSLIATEKAFRDTSDFFSDRLKLNEVAVLGILVALYLMSCILLAKRSRIESMSPAGNASGRSLILRERMLAALHRVVRAYVKYTGPIAAGLATLAAFTLFGLQLGDPANDLQARIKVHQEGYADLARRTEAALSQRVASALYTKIQQNLPPSYNEGLELPGQIDAAVQDVQRRADDAKAKHGVSVPDVDRLIQTETDRARRVNELSPELRVENTDRKSAPGDLSEKQLSDARRALAQCR